MSLVQRALKKQRVSHAGQGSAKVRSYKRKVPSVGVPVIHVDISEEQVEEVEEQDTNSFLDRTSVPVELPTKPKQTNTPPTVTAEATAKVDDMEPQQAPLHRRGSEDYSAFGKMEATARTGEPSTVMKEFGASIDVELVPRHVALLTELTTSPPLDVEDIPMLNNIMDDEQHATMETETNKSVWPADMPRTSTPIKELRAE
ncbi:hypothetical protein DYB25_013501 [Aphanomyces astaci]|uniref:Uncharacterized protein n=1 Tax=Aphanomyces astaci TaxID=112090 RepID=A0A397FXF2_APHAT|nr:hypothetical protein DYB25_013501 [Aphanomyces astaci]RHY42473.1 hypothetical protein DYB38_012383 [Aphanomyces astaci]RHY70915.1 hypothetical protein DYB34_012344 [Aphanomyces astaci]RHY76939.1 hypothetical protein DYB30_012500 [Aphanomyces astaci]RHZ25859.1 hypothetical protein DYB26_003074 [Aphanomyces astaci]